MPADAPENPRQAFYRRIDSRHLAPLWEVLAALVPPQPRSILEPVHWSFAEVLPHLEEAGRLISAEEAERRVLVLENPALRGKSQITRSLYAGIQLLLPGEVAHSHRHTATAIRLVIEGRGGFTSVDGERTPMEAGDFIITPSGTFHDHSNPGSEPVVWLDGLDVPMIQMFEAGFSERNPDPHQLLDRADDESMDRYAHNMRPVGVPGPARNPLFRYPYARTRAVLQRMAERAPAHPCHGHKQEFVDPTTGGPATPTMAAFMQWLPRGFRGAAHRATDGTVFCVVEGEGASLVGERRIEWKPHDVFVVPSWVPVSHECDGDAVLFSFSDRPVQQALRIWKEA
ncbi:gentisate 1,2-dioxygenase [Ramlibacter sp. AW1]|uniref:Gentisate 1,2-dioxygenase n=1 Tax=Ramlibacter aurantiacus TaxID=2801330 RepID=A0A936ZNZ7_9BURK|nr:gentisate 1,2-dioxygenase [Ramlibacter aurantiacus]MBL0421111.1 gentisate 1,2-dioxygenase [Ramlibacter aurantiacus]